MKKIILATLAASALIPSGAHSTKKWSVSFGMEYENSTAGESEVSLAPIVGYRIGDNKIDFMAQLSQEQSGNRPVNGKLEFRYKRSFSGPFGFNPKNTRQCRRKAQRKLGGRELPLFDGSAFPEQRDRRG